MDKPDHECKCCGFINYTKKCKCKEEEIIDYPLYGVEVL